MKTSSASGICLPSWSTKRTSRPTYGGVVGRIAKAFGKPLLPWQQMVADIALEYDPQTKRLAYQDVRLTVPRQSGKSTLILPTVVFRAEAAHLLEPDGMQNMRYAAQTGVDSREQWRGEYVRQLDACKAMKGRYRTTFATGHESVIFKSGARFSPQAFTETSGHGKVLDAGFVDEAFAHKDDRVDQAWDPAMVTRPNAQKWIVSTVGTIHSTYLREKIEGGRAAAEGGLTEGICYVEYSAPPDADPSDEDVWWACQPALGFTQSIEAIRQRFRSMPLNEFRRAHLNQMTDTIADPIIPVSAWTACKDPKSRRQGRVMVAVDISYDRRYASVAIAGLRDDGVPHVQVVRYGEGTEWVLDHVIELAKSKDVIAVAVDKGGPAGSLIVELTNAEVPLALMGTEGMKAACGMFYDACMTGQVRHIGQPELDQALSGAGKREIGDAWGWSRKRGANDISPLVAATVAHWALASNPETTYDPLASFL